MSGKYREIIVVVTVFSFRGVTPTPYERYNVWISNGDIPREERVAVRVARPAEFFLGIRHFGPKILQENDTTTSIIIGHGVQVEVAIWCLRPDRAQDPEGAERFVDKYLNA